MKLPDKLSKLIKGSFFKNVSVLMSGTVIAQVIAFAASPILSRIYDPQVFGVFGLFTAFCGVISVVAAAKYELSIMLPKKDSDAANLLILCIFIVTGVGGVSFLLILFFRDQLAFWMGSSDLAIVLWWAPIAICFTGLYTAFNYWTTRRKQFMRLSVSRILKNTGREGSQVGLSYVNGFQSGGLVIGFVIGEFLSAATLIAQTLKSDYKLLKNSFDLKRIKQLAIEHKDFPKYNAPQTFLNAVSQNVPAILLAFFFNPAIVGLYWFARRILFTPTQLIGNSIRQVFYQRATELSNEKKDVNKLFVKTTGGLALVGLIPLFVLILIGPRLFGIVFGEEWYIAGEYAQWLSLWWFASFINPPSVMMIPVLGKQKFQLIMDVLGIVLRIGAIVIGGLLSNELVAIALFSIVGTVLNVITIVYIYLVQNKGYERI